ncbi:MAG: M28 family peptidase [Bacteroidia bacterium]
MTNLKLATHKSQVDDTVFILDLQLHSKINFTITSMKYILIASTLFLIIAVSSCQGPSKDPAENEGDSSATQKAVLPNNFNADSAYMYIAKQVSFGPRVPNTEPHKKCGEWLETMLKKWADTVIIQTFDAKNYKNEILKAKNLIGSFNPKSINRMVLCAHWDTRPQADQDLKDKTTPSDGANDGASGVGVLLEMARQMHANKPEMGIDIIFFDVEDGGSNDSEIKDSWCLGSQYWAKHPHTTDYMAKNGILLDMVGAKNAQFAREEMSVRFDNELVGYVWRTAISMGYGSYFIEYNKAGITDDHVYLSFYGNVPTIDIIDYSSETESGFGKYWHTHDDNMSVIDKQTLMAVGKTVLQVVRNKDANVVN